ncbi:MAG: hypothetical protein LBO81_06535 [Clostridiales Family XIII bacterium]|jgi:hypothetical protein|nr:hypothetical protein [Clostridiales Family XIII bacterium]
MNARLSDIFGHRGRGSAFPAVFIAAVLLAATVLSGCGLPDLLSDFMRSGPSKESTLTSMQEVNEALLQALKDGEGEILIDMISNDVDPANIAQNLDPFWGAPTQYSIMGNFKDVLLSDEADATPVDVMRVRFNLKPSINYYILKRMKDSDFPLPADQPEAAAVAAALPGIIDEIYPGAENVGDASAYEKVLAVHDWLAIHLAYDDTIPQSGFENGVYGALINRRTMCQGYAEALQLILLAATDVPVKMEIGDGNNGNGQWVGHAWNIVFMDERWYHVDATFDDPVGNPAGRADHCYFGQNDAALQNDHRWNVSYWPAADGTDFLYYRKSGLYAEHPDTFRSIVRSQLEGRKPEMIEIAVKGFEVSEDDLQFIYHANDEISMIYWKQIPVSDARVVKFELTY